MPNNEVYYILIAAKSGEVYKDASGEVELFPDRGDANEKACALRAANPDQHYLIEGPKTKDSLNWQAREAARLADGREFAAVVIRGGYIVLEVERGKCRLDLN